MIRVLIADPHAVVRRGVKEILADTPDIVVAGEASTAAEALDWMRAGPWDLLIVEVAMPERAGWEIIDRARREYPSVPILVLCLLAEPQLAERALKAGVAGYLTKESSPSELLEAIRACGTGGKYIGHTVSEKLAQLGGAAERLSHESLSEREWQVLRLIALGKSATEIAGALALSVKTVSTYRSRILDKMQMKNNAELIHYAVKHRLLDL
jgi:DNA-binding NarL/FixJ family response regulator